MEHPDLGPAHVQIRGMGPGDLDAVVQLAEHAFGPGYYRLADVRDLLDRCTIGTDAFAYVAVDGVVGEDVVGARFTLPPGRWNAGRGAALHPSRWPAPALESAYFQSAFVAPARVRRGIGRALAQRALADLERLGASAVIAHAWKESPRDGARRYLERLGFQQVAICRHYWAHVDYRCPRCGAPPCTCTALEMVLKLPRSAGT